MNDNYYHHDNTIIYTQENIPGPTENSREYSDLLNNFNSQILQHCKCKNVCQVKNCECLHKLQNYNYIPYEGNAKIRYLLNHDIVDNLYAYMECNDMCSCSDQCENRLVQKGPVGGLYFKLCKDSDKGLGLFTSCFLPKGTFICEYAGELITKHQAAARHKVNAINGKSNYIFCINEYSNDNVVQTFVDPTYFGNIGRYMNHSCDPNCKIIPVRVNSPIPKLAIFADVEVPPNTELTFNYGSCTKNAKLDLTIGYLKCLCNSQNCKGYIPYEDYS